MKNKLTLYWLLQLIGWGSIASLNAFGKIALKAELKLSYILAESILFLVSGIVGSHIMRLFIVKNNLFFKFRQRIIAPTLLAWLIGAILLFFGLMLASPLYTYFHNESHEFSKIMFYSTLINSFVYVFFWLLFYYSIKLIRKSNKDKLERQQLEIALKESQLNTLKGQINPHFMFNSLNNIRGLMLEDVAKSREMITRLSEMLRYSLTKNNNDKIALFEELEMVDNYIELSKIQLEDRLVFKKIIDVSLLQLKIPPMLIQMLIENAIKHGISNLPNGGIVELHIIKKEMQLQIKVSNTGKLTESSKSTKLGLFNIKKRLSLLYGNKANFNLKELNETVVATILIPLK